MEERWWLEPREAFRVYPREVLTVGERAKLGAWMNRLFDEEQFVADRLNELSMEELARCRFQAWRAQRNDEHRHRVVKP